ncbi:hypothetical protein N7G274_010308 [Stereocaulon virgatum]|uniref:GPI ethanolamine phosphate transferase 2 n=1 Tax=Stereocaulon virgatum TaxID=373712 RepID=A0ABR3ZWA3_9LECA
MLPRFALLLLISANLLIPIAILVFATGFFPYKPFIPGRASFANGKDVRRHVSAPFDKVVFMVVDALRSDFVYSRNSGFNFTQSLIRSGAAMPFTAHATSPTITMPRVKAITTGSIPSFLDVILNFAESDTTSSLANQDTWLSQLNDKPGGKLVMYGDDTWLKLFPDTFSRADGTSSFFVSDFTEVDTNVTRHVPLELRQSDWNGMIMHYLGLDHIGHKSGPRSPHMVPKQTEMDGIVKQIYQSIESENHLQSTLLILCGDHGMNDAGNHGGSSEGETSPALIFLSPKLQTISKSCKCPLTVPESTFGYYKTVEQSDIVPTLAGLLGFPVPLNNLGIFIPEFLDFWSQDVKVSLVYENAQQILDIVRGTFPGLVFDGAAGTDCMLSQSDGEILSCLWSKAASTVNDPGQKDSNTALQALTEFAKRAQDIMSGTASNYDLRKLKIGILLAAVATVASLATAFTVLLNARSTVLWTFSLTIVYGVMMFASSYIEEEHHFWYWGSSGWLGWLFFKQLNIGGFQGLYQGCLVFPLFAILRVIRSWNQTGQKHAGGPDIARTLLPAHNFILWALVLVTYLDVVQRLSRRAIPWASRQLSSAAAFALGIASLGFKIAFTQADAPELLEGLQSLVLVPTEEASLVAQARAVFFSIFILLLLTSSPIIYQKWSYGGKFGDVLRPLHDLFTLFLMTQSRATNIPLFLLLELQFHVLGWLKLLPLELTLTLLLFQYASFFAFGGSNAISSVDLSNAYNGIAGYNVIAVGILTFCGNWAGSLWWTSATALLLSRQWKLWGQHTATLTTFVSSSVLFVMLACTALRTHLFIWTVFSPKFLYSMAWSMGQHICISIGLGSLLFWIGTW